MSDEQEQIEIPISDLEKKEEPTDIKVEKVEDEPKKEAAPEIDPEEGLRKLREQLEAERAARIEADKRAQQAMASVTQAKNEVQDSNLHLVNNAIATVNQTNEILKANYREAMSVNDYDRAAEIQQQMATNAAKLLQLEQGKEALEKAPKAVPEKYVSSDPVEALASQLTPRSAAWLRAHPQCATDPRLYQKMIAAHNIARADGHEPDTDGYFEAIEDTLKLNRNEPATEADDAMSAAAKPTQKRSAPPSAPVSRSGSGTGSRPNTVRLTSQEREMAQMMGMTDQEYARNKLALQREGKLNH
jgi:hypothetical protein